MKSTDERVREEVEQWVCGFTKFSIRLPPRAVEFLDAMARKMECSRNRLIQAILLTQATTMDAAAIERLARELKR